MDKSDKDTVLVTGGAGYIGSHVALALVDAGRPVVVLDNLSTGQRRLVPEGVPFVDGDCGDAALVAQVLREHGCDAIVHMAGSLSVAESVAQPLDYYRNNVCGSVNLIQAAVDAGVSRFVFSSSASVYGEPERTPITEDMPTRPISPYGTSKLVTEWTLRDVAATGKIRYVALRYFNVAGADPAGRSGETHTETGHLVKIASEAAAGKRSGLTMFGDDYPTRDGTCIRDYVHVSDLAAAHLDALAYLAGGGDSRVLNCGYGRGFSVREILDGVQRVAGHPIPVTVGPRRSGDPATLVADASRAREVLGWRPRFDDIDAILGSALAWERSRP